MPLIFLPGTLCDERIWMPFWKQLSINNRAYVPLQWADDLDQMLALTFDRIDGFKEPVHIVGFSMGGYIGSLAALKRPQNVASLHLFGYFPGGLSEQEMQVRKGIIKQIEQKRYRGLNAARLTQYCTEAEVDQEHITQTILDMEQDLGASVLASHIRATTPRKDLSKALAEQPFPVHFIAGEHDKIAPLEKLRAYQVQYPRTHLDVVKDTAHMMLLSQPHTCATLLEKQLGKTKK